MHVVKSIAVSPETNSAFSHLVENSWFDRFAIYRFLKKIELRQHMVTFLFFHADNFLAHQGKGWFNKTSIWMWDNATKKWWFGRLNTKKTKFKPLGYLKGNRSIIVSATSLISTKKTVHFYKLNTDGTVSPFMMKNNTWIFIKPFQIKLTRLNRFQPIENWSSAAINTPSKKLLFKIRNYIRRPTMWWWDGRLISSTGEIQHYELSPREFRRKAFYLLLENSLLFRTLLITMLVIPIYFGCRIGWATYSIHTAQNEPSHMISRRP